MEIKLDDSNSIKCWCTRCGQEFRIHPLYPLVNPDSLKHDCPRTIPDPVFEYEMIEVRPMEMPSTKLLEMDYKYKETDVSDGLSDAWRMEREALAAEEREEKEKDQFDLHIASLMRNRRDDILEYLARRQEYFHMDEYQQKLYPKRKEELKRELEGMRDALVINFERLAERLKKKL